MALFQVRTEQSSPENCCIRPGAPRRQVREGSVKRPGREGRDSHTLQVGLGQDPVCVLPAENREGSGVKSQETYYGPLRVPRTRSTGCGGTARPGAEQDIVKVYSICSITGSQTEPRWLRWEEVFPHDWVGTEILTLVKDPNLDLRFLS